MALEEQMKKFNINNPIMVKLTDKGINIYYHQHDDLNRFYGKEMIRPSYPKIDAEGFVTFQLWELMTIFGKHFHMGMDQIIEENTIYLHEAYLKEV